MPLVHLVYVSVAQPNVDLREVQDILRAASAANRERDVTGMLLLSNGYFLQVLEGERQVVSDLFRRISADPRHVGCELLAFAEIDTRSFADWSMKLVGPDILEQERRRRALLQHAGSARFEPHKMTAAQCYQFLRSMADLERHPPS